MQHKNIEGVEQYIKVDSNGLINAIYFIMCAYCVKPVCYLSLHSNNNFTLLSKLYHYTTRLLCTLFFIEFNANLI